jgi:hypothetical protein
MIFFVLLKAGGFMKNEVFALLISLVFFLSCGVEENISPIMVEGLKQSAIKDNQQNLSFTLSGDVYEAVIEKDEVPKEFKLISNVKICLTNNINKNSDTETRMKSFEENDSFKGKNSDTIIIKENDKMCTFSDSSGSYFFNIDQRGNFTIKALHDEYELHLADILIGDKDNIILDIALVPVELDYEKKPYDKEHGDEINKFYGKNKLTKKEQGEKLYFEEKTNYEKHAVDNEIFNKTLKEEEDFKSYKEQTSYKEPVKEKYTEEKTNSGKVEKELIEEGLVKSFKGHETFKPYKEKTLKKEFAKEHYSEKKPDAEKKENELIDKGKLDKSFKKYENFKKDKNIEQDEKKASIK